MSKPAQKEILRGPEERTREWSKLQKTFRQTENPVAAQSRERKAESEYLQDLTGSFNEKGVNS